MSMLMSMWLSTIDSPFANSLCVHDGSNVDENSIKRSVENFAMSILVVDFIVSTKVEHHDE